VGYIAGDTPSRRRQVVLDGQALPAPEIALGDGGCSELQFSLDSAHHAFRVSDAKQRRYQFVVDNIPGPVHESVGGLVFSPNGGHWAHSVKSGKQWHVVLDGVAGPLHEIVGALSFSPDSRHFAYTTFDGHQAALMADGTEIAVDGILLSIPRYLSDGTFEWVLKRGDELIEVRRSPN
jgi:hypothetical protein